MREVKFKVKKWMVLGVTSCVTFNLSYLMAATMPPDCAGCHDASTLQIFHFIYTFIFGGAATVSGIASYMCWFEGND